jgi:hypothetical protein
MKAALPKHQEMKPMALTRSVVSHVPVYLVILETYFRG